MSPTLATARRLVTMPWFALTLVALVAALVLLDETWWRVALVALLVVVVAVAVFTWFWAGRNQRSWGYAEAEDDLLVTSGVMFRRLVAVPYGRMQFVDVSAGPIARRLGIATVTLHTASTETAADIPGVPADEARRLRNRLTELGEAHGAGV